MIRAGGCLVAKCPGNGGLADNGALGKYQPHRSRRRPLRQFFSNPKMVVVESNPGTDATRTATIKS